MIGRQYRESHSCNDQPCHVQKVFGVPIFLKHGSQLTLHCRVGMNWLHNGHVECSWVKTITYDQNKNGCVRNIRTPRPFEDRGLWSWIRSIDITRAMHQSMLVGATLLSMRPPKNCSTEVSRFEVIVVAFPLRQIETHLLRCGCQPKNRGTPKWMVYNL